MALANINAYLESVHTALSNLQTDTELNTPMATFGYNAAKIATVMGLYDIAHAAHLSQQMEYAEQYGATAAYEAARAAANTAYMRQLTLARVVYKNDIVRTYKLGLQGEWRQSYNDWRGQTDLFYAAALADTAIQTDLAAFGVTLTALQDAQALIEAADAAWHKQKEEKGEAQEATRLRDEALDKLQDAYSDLITVARVAFAEDAQKLERMGIVVSSE